MDVNHILALTYKQGIVIWPRHTFYWFQVPETGSLFKTRPFPSSIRGEG